MGLLDKLTKQGSNLTSFDGLTPPTMPGSSGQSKLHYEYSLNNNPHLTGKPQPSQLDLDGVTPPKYWDNRPK
jgi:hypothetical protein